jgi:hypothetical protein
MAVWRLQFDDPNTIVTDVMLELRKQVAGNLPRCLPVLCLPVLCLPS